MSKEYLEQFKNTLRAEAKNTVYPISAAGHMVKVFANEHLDDADLKEKVGEVFKAAYDVLCEHSQSMGKSSLLESLYMAVNSRDIDSKVIGYIDECWMHYE